MFNAPYCWCCGEKEHFNGYGCNNPACKEYYKLKELKQGAKTPNKLNRRKNKMSMKNDLLLTAMQEMNTEIKAKRREWEKQGGREDQIDRSNYLDGFFHAWKIANRVYTKGGKNNDKAPLEE